MHMVATDRISSSSSAYMNRVGIPNPFDSPAPRSRSRSGSMTAPSTVGTAVETTPRLKLFTANNRAVQASAPPVMRRISRVSSITDLLDDLDTGKSSEPDVFECPSPATTVATDDEGAPSHTRTPLFGSRKRSLDEPRSPAFTFNVGTPTPAATSSPRLGWPRSGSRARPSMLAASPGTPNALPLFSREGNNTDDDSSFDDDGSLTNLPRMRRTAALTSIMEDHGMAESSTPLRGQATRIKRARSQARPIPHFPPIRADSSDGSLSQTRPVPRFLPIREEDGDSAHGFPATPTSVGRKPPPMMAGGAVGSEFVLSPTFSPSARSQPECHLLPCTTAATDSIMRIEAQTASDLLAGRFNDLYDEKIFVDCRFPYEYEGGHIAGAVNAPTPEILEKLFLERPMSDRRVVVVLHCEYSIQRAPSLASHLRRRDREVNMHRYPHLHYPEIYVLKGGYRNFFECHKTHCEPQNYVEMNDQAFAVDCRQRMLQLNRQFKRTKSMNDAGLCRGLPRPTVPPSLSAKTISGTLFFSGSPQSPTLAGPRTAAPSLLSSSSLPARPRRMARTQSARPGINLIDFSSPR
ncbi:m-phase inducer phosphatase [Coemansia sp. RSA 1813]|nr:m-phase inducer phosphatase [Coemansia sp. RSA 1646]KAJ1774067.1 m-phase inducer phosphatase [Coemansia sp. RSA 1843]KAJ2092542.1 m-phase inducer phosphatase [Coemansia sp. RSA 986]KAJ2216763.1 m-phase inducer phosphatase [Coemansia sp. RSA 487]KAJ2572835.1 m-phase inducer phosphatase [Coemansia sp. RSA 1813]